MTITGGNPYDWAENRPGWITLHEREIKILRVMVKSFKSEQWEEIDLELTEGSGKQKFYRVYVDNLSLAYELLNMSRLSRW
jgi:hypothetical protein